MTGGPEDAGAGAFPQLLNRRRRWRTMAGAGLLAALLLLYVLLVGQRALALTRTGEAVGVALGAVIAVIPLLTLWFLGREMAHAWSVDRLTERLAREGGLDVDDLPRSPGGRVDRASARERFEAARAAVSAEPENWRAWYRVGWAYDAAGDRRRAREALRHAVRLARRSPRDSPPSGA